MPALNHPQPQSLTLPSGLTLSARHEPHLEHCTAVLRVAAGRQDQPAAWPELVYVLEHWLFLGTKRFPAQDNLMTYVQRHGGQVNVQTHERHTDFAFEVRPDALDGALERLCDMLGHPRMNLNDPLRERDVLQVESLVQAREPGLQREPLVGNCNAFQPALNAFYQQFYQAAKMTLNLAGPLPLDELLALGQRCTTPLPVPDVALGSVKEPASAGLIRGQTSAHRGLRTFAQDRLRARRDESAITVSTTRPAPER